MPLSLHSCSVSCEKCSSCPHLIPVAHYLLTLICQLTLPHFFLHKQSSDVRWARQGMMVEVRTGFKINREIQLLLCRSKSSVNSPKSGMVPGVQGGENPKWKTKARTQWGKQLPKLVLKTNSRHYLEKCQCMLLYLGEFLSSKERRKWRTKNSSPNRHTSEIL